MPDSRQNEKNVVSRTQTKQSFQEGIEPFSEPHVFAQEEQTCRRARCGLLSLFTRQMTNAVFVLVETKPAVSRRQSHLLKREQRKRMRVTLPDQAGTSWLPAHFLKVRAINLSSPE